MKYFPSLRSRERELARRHRARDPVRPAVPSAVPLFPETQETETEPGTVGTLHVRTFVLVLDEHSALGASADARTFLSVDDFHLAPDQYLYSLVLSVAARVTAGKERRVAFPFVETTPAEVVSSSARFRAHRAANAVPRPRRPVTRNLTAGTLLYALLFIEEVFCESFFEILHFLLGKTGHVTHEKVFPHLRARRISTRKSKSPPSD